MGMGNCDLLLICYSVIDTYCPAIDFFGRGMDGRAD